MLVAAFIFLAPGADPAIHRKTVETPGVALTAIGVETIDQAVAVAKEMADALTLSIVKKGLVTNLITLDVGYDIENLSGEKEGDFEGETAVDRYGRRVPKGVHGSYNFG